jgi:hypothetical protein
MIRAVSSSRATNGPAQPNHRFAVSYMDGTAALLLSLHLSFCSLFPLFILLTIFFVSPLYTSLYSFFIPLFSLCTIFCEPG